MAYCQRQVYGRLSSLRGKMCNEACRSGGILSTSGLYDPDENGQPPSRELIVQRAVVMRDEQAYLHSGRRGPDVRASSMPYVSKLFMPFAHRAC